MTSIVIDTDIFIDYLRGFKGAKEFIESAKLESKTYFSSITETELVSGKDCENSVKRQDVVDLLSFHMKIPVDNMIALAAGDIRRKHCLGVVDAIIAATTLKLKARLITRNISDFKKVKEVEVVRPY